MRSHTHFVFHTSESACECLQNSSRGPPLTRDSENERRRSEARGRSEECFHGVPRTVFTNDLESFSQKRSPELPFECPNSHRRETLDFTSHRYGSNSVQVPLGFFELRPLCKGFERTALVLTRTFSIRVFLRRRKTARDSFELSRGGPDRVFVRGTLNSDSSPPTFVFEKASYSESQRRGGV